MIYKILIKKSKSAENYIYYQVQSGTEMIDYSTTHIEDLASTYKALLGSYTTEQLKLVHELEPELIIKVEEEPTDNESGEGE